MPTPPEDSDPLFRALVRAASARRLLLHAKAFDDSAALSRRVADALADVHRHAPADCWGEDDRISLAMEADRCA